MPLFLTDPPQSEAEGENVADVLAPRAGAQGGTADSSIASGLATLETPAYRIAHRICDHVYRTAPGGNRTAHY